jgi:two-component system, OmpR family, response regulator CpxR
MDNRTGTILVIDDDRELCSLLCEYLKPEGFSVEAAYEGQRGIDLAIQNSYHLIILDVMLPGKLDGFQVLRTIRLKTSLPILMLSARGEDVDRIIGLEMGADDYLPKPFNPRELLARIRTILRRYAEGRSGHDGSQNGSRFHIGDVRLDTSSRMVQCGGKPVELTGVEFSLLTLLIKNAGRILTRDHLTSEVLGRRLSPYDRSIDVHVSKIRKKLGPDHDGNERIRSIRNSGYVYTALDSAAEIQSSLSEPLREKNA